METDCAALGPSRAIPTDELAQHIAGQGIVGLAIGPQPPADGAVADEPSDGIVLRKPHQVVGPTHLRIDRGQYVLAFLLLEAAGTVDAGAVEDAFDGAIGAADLIEHVGQGLGVRNIAAMIRGLNPGGRHVLEPLVHFQGLLHALPSLRGRLARLAGVAHDRGLERFQSLGGEISPGRIDLGRRRRADQMQVQPEAAAEFQGRGGGDAPCAAGGDPYGPGTDRAQRCTSAAWQTAFCSRRLPPTKAIS